MILAIVEGVTEFLPISSTGHLVLTSELLKITQTEFVKSFEIVIQLGAIMAVVWMYKDKLVKDMKLIKTLGAAFLPTGILGVVAYPYIKGYLLGNMWVTVAALVAGGVVMIGWEMRKADSGQLTIQNLGWKRGVMIGLAQSVAMIPGVSRAMATILGGMGAGLSRREATEFSFLLAIPTMAAAAGLDLVKSGGAFSGREWIMLAVGFGMAFVTAWGAVKWLIGYVQKHDFKAFGVYRIAVGLVFALMGLR